MTVEAGKGELIGYDEYKHRKGLKVHVAITSKPLPLNVAIELGNKHDNRRLVEVLEGLSMELEDP